MQWNSDYLEAANKTGGKCNHFTTEGQKAFGSGETVFNIVNTRQLKAAFGKRHADNTN